MGNCLEARDEYRSYVKGILKMILEQRDAFAIRKYLREAESGMLAGLVNEKRIELVVGLLTKVSESRQS